MNGLILCTKECNLRCTYCFEDSMRCGEADGIKTIREKFSQFLDDGFEKFVRELIAINDSLGRRETDITFHGGEPLMIGADLLERGLKIVRKYPNTTIGMQTNGTMINDDIIELLRDYDVKVGVSLDGPQHIHDAYRKSIGGKDTHSIIMDNIDKMRRNGVIVGALATVTDETVKDPEAFYDFFVKNDLSFSFNPCFSDPNYPNAPGTLNYADFIKFYKRMFDLWISDNDSNLPISCFERIMSAMSVKSSPYMEVCSYIPDCSMTTVAINTNGDFYRCLHYCMDEKNRIGNIKTDNLNLALGNCAITGRWEQLKKTECADCDIQDYCCGGCPYVAEAVNGTIFSRANTCESQKAIVHYIYDFMKGFVKDEAL